MKLYVSVDIEGVAGVVHWDQVMPQNPEYALGRRLLMEEVNALCRGAIDAGVDEIVINDAHGPMRNLIPDQLAGPVRLITGHFKPMYMMEGLDESFDAAVFLGYHGPYGAASVLSHSYSPRAIWQARMNAEVTGETGINALVAHHYRVPVILITGDDHTTADAKRWIPEASPIEVKRSIGRFAAESITPAESRDRIFAGIQAALASPVGKPSYPPNTQLELTFQSAEMAVLAEWAGARRTQERVAIIEGSDALDIYRRFHMTLLLCRAVSEA